MRRTSVITAVASLTLLLAALALPAQQPEGGPLATVHTLQGHGDAVYTVAFSPDGRYVATGSFDKAVKLWDVQSGKEIKTYAGPTGHQSLVMSVAFSPDGKLLASGGADNGIKLWDVPTTGPLREFLGHADGLNAVALSADGTRLATGGSDKTVRVWNTADGKPLFSCEGHTAAVRGVAFSPTGPLLASVGDDQTLRLWNAADGRPAGSFTAHAGPATAVAFHPNGATAFTAGQDGAVKFWHLPPAAPRSLPEHPGAVTAVALSADGAKLVTASEKTIRISAFATGAQERVLTAPAHVNAVAVSGALVAAGAEDGTVLLWTLNDGAEQARFNAGAAVKSIALHPNPNLAQVAVGTTEAIIKIWEPGLKAPAEMARTKAPLLDPATKKLTTPTATTFYVQAHGFPLEPAASGLLGAIHAAMRGQETVLRQTLTAHPGGVTGLAYLPGGAQLVSGGGDKLVKLWDVATGKEARGFSGASDAVGAIALGREATPARVAACAGRAVLVWGFADGKLAHTFTHSATTRSVSFSPDGSRLVTGADDGHVVTWDLTSGKELQAFPQVGAVQAVAFHHDNRAVVAGTAARAVAILPLTVTRLIAAHAAPIHDLAVTPSGSHILTASADGTAKLFNAANGTMERTFTGHTGPVTAVAVTKNGAAVVTGGEDKTVRVFNLADAKLLKALPHPAAVRGIALSPNNALVAAACANNQTVVSSIAHTPGQALPGDFGKVTGTFSQAGPVTAVAFNSDSATIFTASADKTAKAWKFPTDTPVRALAGHSNHVDAIAFNNDGSVLASGGHDSTLRLWNEATGTQTASITVFPPTPPGQPTALPVYCVAWSPDNKYLVAGGLAGNLKLIDVATKNQVREFKAYHEKDFPKGHQEGVYTAVFSPDGKFLVSAGSDMQMKVWNVADGSVVRQFADPDIKRGHEQAHDGWISMVRFTPDGTRLVSVDEAGWFKMWSFADSKLLFKQKFSVGLYAVALSPDGKLAVTGNRNSTVFVLKMP